MSDSILQAFKMDHGSLPETAEGEKISRDLLRDESRMEGNAERVFFPVDAAGLAGAMEWASSRGKSVTVSGGRTGIAGGAAPQGGVLISLSRMKKIGGLRDVGGGRMAVTCDAGVTLSELQNYLLMKKCPCFFPPDPTETSATIGGMIACNASGAHTFRHGPTRGYVRSLTAVLYNGDMLRVERGTVFAGEDGHFSLRFSDGKESEGKVPLYKRPSTKNAAGYFSGEGMDLIDLFIGSEGTLAAIAEAELELIPKPELVFNAMFFTSDEAAAVELTETLRSEKDVEVTALEYFDPAALRLLRRARAEKGTASGTPPGLPENPRVAGVYIDVAAAKKATASSAGMVAKIASGLGEGKIVAEWAAFDRDERERLRKFRHALPETVNSIIAERRRTHPSLTKLGTDMAVPDENLREIIQIYRDRLDKKSLEYVMFGHIGNNHLHVNILPKNPDEYNEGKKIYADFAREVLRMGGSISAEHGIGRLKRNFLAMMFGEEGIAQMRAVKKVFDPESLMAPGILF